MSNVYGTAMLSHINIEDNKDLLDLIANKNNDLKIEFYMSAYNINKMFKYYVVKNIEYINDLDNYECIFPEVIKDGNEFKFTLNASTDEEYLSDITFLDREFKKHFGLSILNCDVIDILRIILMQCEYVIENDLLKIKIYYETYKKHWIKDFFKEIN